jgi:hypothetical protein
MEKVDRVRVVRLRPARAQAILSSPQLNRSLILSVRPATSRRRFAN